ncbi:hypothetical protein V5799_016131 [Amblyomma americanum]|uniref:Uncharacterized protein n=1 Tax=Amblyomma americanum TaxID=6943 RepID=A0AAQ4F5Z1_AMBAM
MCENDIHSSSNLATSTAGVVSPIGRLYCGLGWRWALRFSRILFNIFNLLSACCPAQQNSSLRASASRGGIKKKLAVHAKRAGCSVLEMWIQPASNHLY